MAGYTNFASSTNLSLIDPHWDSVVLYVDFDGSDAATSATDESNSAHGLTFNGNAQLDDAQSVFGGTSLLLDGTGDYVSAADSADWHFGTGEFTVEVWTRLNTTSASTRALIAQRDATGADSYSWRISYNTGFTGFTYSLNGTTETGVQTVSTLLTTGQWYHIAASRDSAGLIRLHIDGVTVASATEAGSLFNSDRILEIGSLNAGTGNFHDGWIDSVRVTKGVCRYPYSNFNVPLRAFPAVGPA